ncbi:MAG TPA: hypothetical protein VJ742_13090 [Nitrososphaera sp.]|nr:hypothetical protein [Nitrososphaera sp.]
MLEQKLGKRKNLFLLEEPPERRVISAYVPYAGKPTTYHIPFPWLYYVVSTGSEWSKPIVNAIFAAGEQRSRRSKKSRIVRPLYFLNQYGYSPCYEGEFLEETYSTAKNKTAIEQGIHFALQDYWQENFNCDGTYVHSEWWCRFANDLKGVGDEYDYEAILKAMEKMSVEDICNAYSNIEHGNAEYDLDEALSLGKHRRT